MLFNGTSIKIGVPFFKTLLIVVIYDSEKKFEH